MRASCGSKLTLTIVNIIQTLNQSLPSGLKLSGTSPLDSLVPCAIIVFRQGALLAVQTLDWEIVI